MATMYPQDVLDEFGLAAEDLGGLAIDDETACWWIVQDEGRPNRRFLFGDSPREVAARQRAWGGEVDRVLRSPAGRVLVSYDNGQDTPDTWVLLRADRELYPEGA